MGSTRVATLIAAHNRRDLTLACLRSLDAQRVPGLTIDAFVLDDGSSDGTSEAVAERFPEAVLLHGDGQLYWTGGMRRAFEAAIADDYDHYLWLNDDVYLDNGALTVLLDTERQLRQRGETAIVVGSTRDPQTGQLTYGGVVRPYRWRRMRWELVQPGDAPYPCETMNGQVVLIPRAVVQRIGNIDPTFVQLGGDYDYGLRARAAGCSVWIAPGTLGGCAPHPQHRTDQQPVVDEWRRLWSQTELVPGPWAVFNRRWGGRLWPLYWLSPYVRRGSRIVLERTPLRRTVAGRQ